MNRLILALLVLVACSEPQRDPLDGLWQGSAGGHSLTVILSRESDGLHGSLNVTDGPLCSQVGGPGVSSGSAVSVYFYDCIQPSGPTIQLQGTLDGDRITGTLNGWTFTNAAATLNR